MPNRTALPLLIITCLCFISSAQAQEIRVVENPLQEELEYRVGTVLQPGLSVDGILWRALKIEAKEGQDLEPGKDVSTTLSVEFENTGASKAQVLTIILLEDERGRQLDRIEIGSLKIGDGDTKDQRKKIKMDGGLLARVRKVWAYVEVVRD